MVTQITNEVWRPTGAQTSRIDQRAKIGVVMPATNTVFEQDLQRFNLPGVTWHPSCFAASSSYLALEDTFLYFLELIRLSNVLSNEPTHIVMGLTAESAWVRGGVERNHQFASRVVEQLGHLGLTTGPNACRDALRAFGAKKIAVLAPYHDGGSNHVRAYFTELGYDVKHVVCLGGQRDASNDVISEDDLILAVRELDGPDVDAIVQVGANLSTLELFPFMEKWLRKPCLPINVITAWHALRKSGVRDKINGLGWLMEHF